MIKPLPTPTARQQQEIDGLGRDVPAITLLVGLSAFFMSEAIAMKETNPNKAATTRLVANSLHQLAQWANLSLN